MTDRSFERANDESRRRLARLVESLTSVQLAVDLGEGWTVASALGHMGFWDRWQATRWMKMLAGTWTAESESILAAEHLANDALHPYWAGASAEDIPGLAVEAAAAVDALIASAPDALVDSLEGTSIGFLVHRHRHRTIISTTSSGASRRPLLPLSTAIRRAERRQPATPCLAGGAPARVGHGADHGRGWLDRGPGSRSHRLLGSLYRGSLAAGSGGERGREASGSIRDPIRAARWDQPAARRNGGRLVRAVGPGHRP